MNNEDKIILEEYVQEFNENKKKYKLAYSTGFGKFWSDFVKAIENLINRNKQLEADNYEQNNIINNYIEIEKEHKKENGELREKVKELESELQHKREKIEDKIKELEKGTKNIFIRGEKILVLQELLQEGDNNENINR